MESESFRRYAGSSAAEAAPQTEALTARLRDLALKAGRATTEDARTEAYEHLVKILERPMKLAADAKLREVFGRWGVDPDDVDDVTILACIQLFKELPRYRPGTEVIPWVATIVRSQAVIFARWKHHLRADAAKRMVKDDRARWMAHAPRQDPHLRACIDRVVARLRPDQRDVYELVFVEDRSVAEAARMLGRSPTWVRERIKKLRAEFSGIR